MEIINVGYGEALALNVSQGEYVKAGYSGEYEKLRADLAAAKERERTKDILLEQQGDKLAALNDDLAAAKDEIDLNEINLGLAVDYQKQLISDFHAERTELKQQLATAKEEVRDKCADLCNSVADSFYNNGMKDSACAAWNCEAEIREMEL